MLTKKYRLIKQQDFSRVFQRGRSCFNRFLGVKAVKNNLSATRLGISISLKVDKRATKRNLLKRRISEAWRLNLAAIAPGYDILIIALPPLKEKSFQQISGFILDCLKKLNVIAVSKKPSN